MKNKLIILTSLILLFITLHKVRITSLTIQSSSLAIKQSFEKTALLLFAILILLAVIITLKIKLKDKKTQNIRKIKVYIKKELIKKTPPSKITSTLSLQYNQDEINHALKESLEEISQD